MSTSPAPAEDPRLNELFEAIIDGTISAASHRPYGDLYLRFFPLHMEMEIMPTEPEDVDLFAERVLDGVSAYCLEVRDHLYAQRGQRLISLTIEVNASNGLVAISLNFDEHPQRLGGDFMPTAPVAADVLAHPVEGELPEWLQEAVDALVTQREDNLNALTPAIRQASDAVIVGEVRSQEVGELHRDSESGQSADGEAAHTDQGPKDEPDEEPKN